MDMYFFSLECQHVFMNLYLGEKSLKNRKKKKKLWNVSINDKIKIYSSPWPISLWYGQIKYPGDSCYCFNWCNWLPDFFFTLRQVFFGFYSPHKKFCTVCVFPVDWCDVDNFYTVNQQRTICSPCSALYTLDDADFSYWNNPKNSQTQAMWTNVHILKLLLAHNYCALGYILLSISLSNEQW